MINFKFYISPFFLSRYYLNKDIRYVVAKYKFEGDLLDFGCGSMPYRNIFIYTKKYLGIDFELFSENTSYDRNKPDFYFQDNYLNDFKLQFKNSEFDNIVAFQVLEHHINPGIMVSEISRVVKKDGLVLITVPFMGGVHESPHDYQRFTRFGLLNLAKKNDFKVIDMREQGSIFSTTVMLFSEYLNSIAAKNKINFIIISILFVPVLLLQYLCILLDKFFVTKDICFNYILVLKKM